MKGSMMSEVREMGKGEVGQVRLGAHWAGEKT